MTDSESQDSVSMDAAYENLMQEVLKESQERIATPTEEVNTEKFEHDTFRKSGYYLFENVCYLGSSVIQKQNDPIEVNRCISDFSKQNQSNYTISLLVPFSNRYPLQMVETETQNTLATFPIFKIGFCTSGYKPHHSEYLAFSFLQMQSSFNTTKPVASNESTRILQCHIFKFKSSFFTDRILDCFRKAFESASLDSMNCQSNALSILSKSTNVKFKMTIEIKEDDGRGNFATVCKEDNSIFKLRSNIKKKIIIKFEQIEGSINLHVERCMGLFIGAGRYLNDADMSLLEMDSLGEVSNKTDAFTISGEWNPNEKGLEMLNNTREKDQQMYMTIGVNLYVQEIEAPLCLKVVCTAKIYSETQRFWLNLKKATILHVMLSLEDISDPEINQIKVGKFVTKTIQYIWPDKIITMNCQPNLEGGSTGDSDNEELLKSGGGIVSKEITDEQLLHRWGDLLGEWQSDIMIRPKGLTELVRHGIPEALRGEVWQLMASSLSKESELHDVYRILITKETKYDAAIKRDMPRTFTANPMFLQKDGHGQQALFHVCKAYASYDEEIGYCQGSAFLTAALILHMPEEQAFSLLVTIMHNYKIRDLFRNNFEGLHICLYQLDHLMAEKLTDLHQHFTELELESHMYANQWFMTLFTMKFHLYAVFHILDLFFNEGIVIIFKVALALLKLNRKELLALNFEGALNYFRTTLPKLYRNVDSCKELIHVALNMKISNSKLTRLEREWRKIQEVRAETEDPLEIMHKELKKTKDEYNRLDQENDALAKELVLSKISLQKNIDKLEETVEILTKELFTTRNSLTDALDEKHHLQDELQQVKIKFREEVLLREEKSKQQEEIIMEYKRIATQLSERAEISKSCTNLSNGDDIIDHLKSVISKCQSCSDRILENSRENSEESDENFKDKNQIICMTREEFEKQRNQMYETELILANTKLLLVESHCTEQKHIHELNYLKNIVAEQKEIIDSSNSSIIKKFLNLREKQPPPPSVVTDHKNDQSTASKLEIRHSFCQSDTQDKVLPTFHHSLSQDWV